MSLGFNFQRYSVLRQELRTGLVACGYIMKGEHEQRFAGMLT